MQRKFVPVQSFLVIGLALAACGPFETAGSQQATAIAAIVLATQTAQAASLPPTPALPAAAAQACPVPTDGTLLLKQEDAGYCLLYPAGHGVLIPFPGEVSLMPGDPPYIGSFPASVTLNVEPAAGRTAAQVADKVAVDMNCSDGPYGLTVAGEKAVVLSECKGVDLTRKVFIIHADRLYTLTFGDLSDRFYTQVMTSFTFLH